jgi:hypothetical protein
MRKTLTAVAGTAMLASSSLASAQQLYVEYYRNNLFLGLAYHRIGCLTNWSTIQSNQDYDGFSSSRYCHSGRTADSVPDGEWFAWNYASAKAQLDTCGNRANTRYGTPNYAARSNRCNYNVVTDCNSDCWIRHFSGCQGKRVPIASPCW